MDILIVEPFAAAGVFHPACTEGTMNTNTKANRVEGSTSEKKLSLTRERVKELRLRTGCRAGVIVVGVTRVAGVCTISGHDPVG
jgi:hypothetical protein